MSGPTVVWMNEALVAAKEARVSVFDRGLAFCESVYEVLPIVRGASPVLVEHADRLRRGADRIGIGAGAPAAPRLGAICEALVRAEDADEGLVYVQLTGGEAPRAHVATEPPTATLFAYLTPERLPRAAERARPLGAVSCPDERWAHCDMKTTMLLPAVLAKRAALAAGADEALFVGPGGEIREGASSNVFAVRRGEIVTPPCDAHILPGITRDLVLAIARDAGMPAREATLSMADALGADEVFITSSRRLAAGIAAIDGRPIGAGAPGPITTRLGALLAKRLGLPD